MLFGNKKKISQDVLRASSYLIQDNATSMDVLISMARDDEAVVERLKKIQDKVKYLSPSESKEVADCDKRITAKIGDIKILLVKAKTDMFEKVNEELDSLEFDLIETRIAKAKRKTV